MLGRHCPCRGGHRHQDQALRELVDETGRELRGRRLALGKPQAAQVARKIHKLGACSECGMKVLAALCSINASEPPAWIVVIVVEVWRRRIRPEALELIWELVRRGTPADVNHPVPSWVVAEDVRAVLCGAAWPHRPWGLVEEGDSA